MTFSVVGHDAATGELGVAVASGVLAVGRAVPWAQAGVGAVATQSRIRRGYGPHALRGLVAGVDPAAVLATLTARDAGAQTRQVGIVAADGRAAAHTGSDALPACGHVVGDGYTVQGNLLVSDRVLPAMAEAFRYTPGPLAERLVAALAAGERWGGDLRGRQSAAVLVVGPIVTTEPWDEVPVDLRVDDSPDPVTELTRLLVLQRTHEGAGTGAAGDVAPSGPGDLHAALDAARRGDLAGARAAVAELRTRPGWDTWLRENVAAGRLPHLARLLD
jgi:uncharacterized Ntn-hydrolase superfamily protein